MNNNMNKNNNKTNNQHARPLGSNEPFSLFFSSFGVFSKKSSTSINKVDIQLHGNKATQQTPRKPKGYLYLS